MENCRHLFREGACALCGASMLAVQIQTTRPSPAEELRNKLREMGEPTVETAEPSTPQPPQGLFDAIRTLAPTREEHKQSVQEIYAAIGSAVAELEARLKAHVEERLLAPERAPTWPQKHSQDVK